MAARSSYEHVTEHPPSVGPRRSADGRFSSPTQCQQWRSSARVVVLNDPPARMHLPLPIRLSTSSVYRPVSSDCLRIASLHTRAFSSSYAPLTPPSKPSPIRISVSSTSVQPFYPTPHYSVWSLYLTARHWFGHLTGCLHMMPPPDLAWRCRRRAAQQAGDYTRPPLSSN